MASNICILLALRGDTLKFELVRQNEKKGRLLAEHREATLHLSSVRMHLDSLPNHVVGGFLSPEIEKIAVGWYLLFALLQSSAALSESAPP